MKGHFTPLLEGITERIMHSSEILHRSAHKPSQQSFRNLRGSWFETIVGLVSWNTCARINEENASKVAIVKLPSANVMHWWELLNADALNVLGGLFGSLNTMGITMTLPNPDFVCVTELDKASQPFFENKITKIGLGDLDTVNQAYQRVRGLCHYRSIKFGLSVKHEIKPDRRYLIVYEGSHVKAMVSHLQGRYWDSSYAIKYYGLVHQPMSKPDREVFLNPSIDSITDVHAIPRKAVDEMVQVDTVEQTEEKVKSWVADR